jgi:hypothetical protein
MMVCEPIQTRLPGGWQALALRRVGGQRLPIAAILHHEKNLQTYMKETGAMKQHHLIKTLAVTLGLLTALAPVQAQEPVFPLPADLYILTSEHVLLHIDAVTGEQTLISEEQHMADFDVAPDGEWLVYRQFPDNAVFASQIAGGSGFALELDAPPPPDVTDGPSIAWSPDAAAVAYLTPDGVRIAELGSGEYGATEFKTIQGGPWVDLEWTGPDTLVVRDAQNRYTQIAGQDGRWTVESLEHAPVRAEAAVPASLIPEGVLLQTGRVVPGTAGALAYEWAPPSLPVVDGVILPDNLYYIAPDETSTPQVWQLPKTGAPARPLTSESAPVLAYAVAPGQAQIAYLSGNSLVAADLDGTERRELATLQATDGRAALNWSPDGAQIAFSDARGLWLVPADGSQSPRSLAQNVTDEQNISSIQVYSDPRWSPDGTRLLVSIGFYEGAVLGVLDVASGDVIQFSSMVALDGRWTDNGRVLTWASEWGYVMPGLYILDPAAPDTSQTALDERYAVLDVAQTASGTWLALVGSTTGLGPRFLRVLAGETVAGPFTPVFDRAAGGFAQMPQLAAGPDGQLAAAGLRAIQYNERGSASGNLVVIDMRTSETVRVDTGGPVSAIRWGQ